MRPSPCLGLCERAPAVLVQCAGEGAKDYVVAPADASRFSPLTPTLAPLRGERAEGERAGSPSAPQTQDARRATLRLLAPRRPRRSRRASTTTARTAATRALPAALALGPDGVIREALASKLQGRGGAAFPAGRKWEAVAKQPARPHYLVCNADESEPGTFKDRVLMEEDPFAVVEAMTIVAFATGCEKGYIYIRGEYPLATERVEAAIAAARAAGLLGADILGKGLAFDVEIRRGAGAYICGEETALFNSIEGFRGEPRNKPPFPVEKGLFGKPTVINNVETLVNVLQIVARGRRGLRRDRHGAVDRPQALLPLRPRRAPRRLRGRRSARRCAS